MTRSRLTELFGVDLRSLALFRIAVAGLLLADLARRAGDFTMFYTEAGVLPVEAVRGLAPRAAQLSLHVLVGSSTLAVAALFALAAAAAVALGIGWRTRAATAVSWVLLLSMHARNPWLSLMGGDGMLRLLLFWSMFLPLGARMSLDARRDPALRSAPALYFSAATVALLGQICVVYFTTGLLKSGELWADGTAVRYALEIDSYVTPFGVWLRENAAPLLPLATYGTVWFERLGPLLAFVPIANGPIRTAAVALFFAFHLSLAAGLDIGIFPFAAMVGWLAFLPAWFWDVALRRPEPVAADPPTPLRVRWPVQLLVGAIFAWVVMSAVAVSLGVPNPSPRRVIAVADLLRLSQVWAMFAPNPPVLDVWIERIGETHSGEKFDVDRGDRANWDRPERIADLQSWNWRIWLGYFQGLAIDDPMRKTVLDRLAFVSCRDWNTAHPEGQRFETMYIVQFVERALPVGTDPLKRLILLRRTCAPL